MSECIHVHTIQVRLLSAWLLMQYFSFNPLDVSRRGLVLSSAAWCRPFFTTPRVLCNVCIQLLFLNPVKHQNHHWFLQRNIQYDGGGYQSQETQGEFGLFCGTISSCFPQNVDLAIKEAFGGDNADVAAFLPTTHLTNHSWILNFTSLLRYLLTSWYIFYFHVIEAFTISRLTSFWPVLVVFKLHWPH